MGSRVLFVSKPVTPPWNDGSKNLVRDVAGGLRRAAPTVMTTTDGPDLGPNVALERIYLDAGRFAPAFTANARVMTRLLRGDPQDIWHFVFAPNAVSSAVAALARRTRRVGGWRGKVVQTVASVPRRFDRIDRLLFGDVVVALSQHTRGRLLGAGATFRDRTLCVIPPCARPPRDVPRGEARATLSLPEGPIVVYPGDWEVSRGAETVALAAPMILRRVPDATIVFACRQKTERATLARREVEAALAPFGSRIRYFGDVDMAALLAVASVVAFPVDDLYGKVDLPLVLLEAAAMRIPLVVASGGPLEALDFAAFAPPADPRSLTHEVVALLRDDAAARDRGEAGYGAYLARYTPEVVAPAYDDLYDTLAT